MVSFRLSYFGISNVPILEINRNNLRDFLHCRNDSNSYFRYTSSELGPVITSGLSA